MNNTIYVALSGGFGPLAQVLPTVEKLRNAGCNIICSATSPSGSKLLEKMNYGVVYFPEIEKPEILLPKGPKWWNLDYYWGRAGYLDINYVRKLVESRMTIIKKINPSIIITMFNPPAAIAARILKIPLVSFTQSCMYPDGKRVCWWDKSEPEYKRSSDVVNIIFKDWKVSPIQKMEDLNKGQLNIIASFPEFDPVTDRNVIYIGPSTWEGEQKSNFNINNIDDKDLIFVYTGHMYDTAGPSGLNILKNVISAFNNTNYNVIISVGLGQKKYITNIPQFSSNIKIYEWVPSYEIAKKSKLLIHHGGHGCCMMGILCGVPSLIIPTFSEREFNARQMEKLHVGKYLYPNEFNDQLLYRTAHEIIMNKKMYDSVQKWETKIKQRKYGGPVLAQKKILELIK